MGPVKSIEHLPDELLVEIFASLAFDDLVHSVQYVCSRWRDVGQDHLLWRNRVYSPDWRLSDEKIASVVRQTPKLQTLLLRKKGVKSVVLNAITQNCPYLRKLEFCDVQKLSIRVLKNLFNNCPNLECLSLPSDVFFKDEQTKIVAQFPKLKILKICGWVKEEDPCILLRIIADGCPALEHIDLGERKVTTHDLKYFLDKKGAQLHTFAVRWDNVDLKCNLPLLLGYPSLKSLNIRSFSEVETQAGFKALRSLKTLTSLTFGFLDNAKVNDLMGVFQEKSMDQLEELRISFYYNYEDRLAEVIVKNCPKLKVLYFEECSNLTDISLKKLYTLQSLQDINLCCTGVSDDGVTYITKCKNLRYLNLDNCNNITEEGMKVMLDISELRVLKMRSCDVGGFPFSLVPTHLKNLMLLNINYCKNVDEDAVAKLRSAMPNLDIRAFTHEGIQPHDDIDHDSFLADATFLFEQFQESLI
ncbi:F-box and leucine-rich repeat protein 13 [Anabrus simplex]|uniref:F-box and leucine-rich repeat protein 13 n=1 Tax=Anabrus simplex TaxID=316456 RepID=UPI0035A386D2